MPNLHLKPQTLFWMALWNFKCSMNYFSKHCNKGQKMHFVSLHSKYFLIINTHFQYLLSINHYYLNFSYIFVTQLLIPFTQFTFESALLWICIKLINFYFSTYLKVFELTGVLILFKIWWCMKKLCRAPRIIIL